MFLFHLRDVLLLFTLVFSHTHTLSLVKVMVVLGSNGYNSLRYIYQ